MRISDWSSDVCSSDLDRFLLDSRQTADARADRNASAVTLFVAHVGEAGILQRLAGGVYAVDDERIDLQIGRASCRERVCPSVSLSVVAVSLKKKNRIHKCNPNTILNTESTEKS